MSDDFSFGEDGDKSDDIYGDDDTEDDAESEEDTDDGGFE